MTYIKGEYDVSPYADSPYINQFAILANSPYDGGNYDGLGSPAGLG